MEETRNCLNCKRGAKMMAIGIGKEYCFQLFDYSGSMGSVIPKEMTEIHKELSKKNGIISIARYGHNEHCADKLWKFINKKIALAKDVTPQKIYKGYTGREATCDAIAECIQWIFDNVKNIPCNKISFYIYGDGNCDTKDNRNSSEECLEKIMQAREMGWKIRFFCTVKGNYEYMYEIYGITEEELIYVQK